MRASPFRGKFRNSFARPEPFVPGQPAAVDFELPDVFHTFRRGHRLMVHVQSSWFPMIDRNPQVMQPRTRTPSPGASDGPHEHSNAAKATTILWSSMFPGPNCAQTFCDIFKCGEEAFVKATHRIYTAAVGGLAASHLELPVLAQP